MPPPTALRRVRATTASAARPRRPTCGGAVGAAGGARCSCGSSRSPWCSSVAGRRRRSARAAGRITDGLVDAQGAGGARRGGRPALDRAGRRSTPPTAADLADCDRLASDLRRPAVAARAAPAGADERRAAAAAPASTRAPQRRWPRAGLRGGRSRVSCDASSSAGPTSTRTYASLRPRPAADRSLPGHRVGRLVAAGVGHVELYYFFPLDEEQQTLDLVQQHDRCSPALALVLLLGCVAYLVTRLVVTPVRVAARTAQRLSDGCSTSGWRSAARTTWPRWPRRSTRWREPAAPDPPAGGDVAAAAPVHLRRLARAAHAADHGPDGRRPDLHDAGRLRPAGGPQRRAAAGRAGPVRGACSPSCWRSAGSTPASPRWTPSRPTCALVAAGGRAARAGGRAGRRRVDWSDRRPTRSSPRSTCAGSSGSCAT